MEDRAGDVGWDQSQVPAVRIGDVACYVQPEAEPVTVGLAAAAGVEDRLGMFGGYPVASSAISTLTSSPSDQVRTCTTVPGGVCLTALDSRLNSA